MIVDGENRDFADLEKTRAAAHEHLDTIVRGDAQAAGAANVEVDFDYAETAPVVEGKPMFMEATLTARASGRPALSGAIENR
jgi:hypothetical protein